MAEFELPSTDTLRRSALSRSARRGATVAQRRLLLRWLGWTAGQALRWLVLPALLIAAAFSALYPGEPPAEPAAPPPARPDRPPAAEPGLHLRLDADAALDIGPPAAAPQAQSGASPIVLDRSSSER